jgi:hypothetical protein
MKFLCCCRYCRWFVGSSKEEGRCHRYPPKSWGRPLMRADDFCGEFKPNMSQDHGNDPRREV